MFKQPNGFASHPLMLWHTPHASTLYFRLLPPLRSNLTRHPSLTYSPAPCLPPMTLTPVTPAATLTTSLTHPALPVMPRMMTVALMMNHPPPMSVPILPSPLTHASLTGNTGNPATPLHHPHLPHPHPLSTYLMDAEQSVTERRVLTLHVKRNISASRPGGLASEPAPPTRMYNLTSYTTFTTPTNTSRAKLTSRLGELASELTQPARMFNFT